MKIVFAYHSEDPVSPTEVKYHEFRGVKSILLLSSVDTRKANVTGWKTFNMTTRNVRKTLLKILLSLFKAVLRKIVKIERSPLRAAILVLNLLLPPKKFKKKITESFFQIFLELDNYFDKDTLLNEK